MKGGINLLAWRTIRANGKRSTIISLAIIMTAILFTTVISITVRLNQANEIAKQLATGSNFHATIEGIKQEQAEQIMIHKLVKEAYFFSYGMNIRYHGSEQNPNDPVLFSCANPSILEHMFIQIQEGYYPKEQDEILLDFEYLKRMNLPAVVGSKLTLYVENNNEIEEHTYILSGYYSSKADWYATRPALINDDLDEDVSVFLILNNSINIEGKVEQILSDLSIDSNYQVNEAYSLARARMFDIESLALFIFIVFIVFFCGFLLIYNIYYIMLAHDLHFYGLLKTIGAAKAQLKKIVFYQVNFIFFISMPLGLILGYFIGWRVLSPIFMTLEGSESHYDFQVYILIFVSLFTYLTSITSAVLPVNKVTRLSCREALTGEVKGKNNGKLKYSQNGAKPWRMAISNLRRGSKRNIVMITSISLSILLFMFIYTTVSILINLQDVQIADFCIKDDVEIINDVDKVEDKLDDKIEDKPYYREFDYRLTQQTIDQIYMLAGVTSVIPIYTTTVVADIDEMVGKRLNQKLVDQKADSIITEYTLEKGKIAVYAYGLPEETMDYLETRCLTADDGKGISNTYQLKRFQSGGYALINSFRLKDAGYDPLSYYLPGEIINLNILKNQYKVLALGKPGRALIDNFIAADSYPMVSLDIYLPYDEFIKEFSDYSILSINVFAEDENREFVKEQLKSLLSSNAVIRDKREVLTEFQSRLKAIRIVGYSLCFIVFLIGVLNYMNTVICGIYERRNEIALLEIVGMTRQQMKQMLLWESMIYYIITTITCLLLGIPLIKVFLNKALDTNMVVHVNMIPFVVMIVFLMLIGVVTTFISYHMETRLTPIERLSRYH
jgi:putative ABC transport system permease protein